MNRNWQLITESIDRARISSPDSNTMLNSRWGLWEMVEVQPTEERARLLNPPVATEYNSKSRLDHRDGSEASF